MRLASFAAACALAAVLFLARAFAANVTLAHPDEPSFTAKELAQGYRDTSILARPRAAHRATVDADEAREHIHVHQKFARFGDLRLIEPATGETADAAIARLRATGRYDYVERDRIVHVDATPNDSRFSQQWQYNNTGTNGGQSGRVGADIAAVPAWDILHDAPDVIVAIVDTGARATHADLAANLWVNPHPTFGDINGARFLDTGTRTAVADGNIDDTDGHGTHVAGIIGAVGNNGSAGAGVTGVAWKVKLMIVKFIGSNGSGALSDEIAGLNYALAHGANIINASFGETESGPPSLSEVAAITNARAQGVIFVAAAGNASANMDVSRHYPASHPLDNIVAVGSSTRLEDVSSFSNYGSGAVELFAPGESILSLGRTNDTAAAVLSGTSMAAPMVSGSLALMKEKFPGDSYRQLINRLLRSTTTSPAYAGKAQTGGRLNLYQALSTTDDDRRPLNDDFARRVHLVGDNIATRSNNVGATAENTEPFHAGISGGVSLWWEWTSPVTQTVNIDTAGSGYDTLLAVYTGTSLTSLAPVAANDNDGSLPTSRLTFTAQAGTTYEIAVDGKNGATGLTVLNVGIIPSNDAFANAAALTGRSTLVNANNAQASREPGEPLILGNSGGRSLWYKWTAPASGSFQVSLASEDLDPLLAVYTGADVSHLTLISSGEALAADSDSTQVCLCSFSATAGTTYYFTVDAKAGSFGVPTGQFTLSLTDALWQTPTKDIITSSPAVGSDGAIYVGSDDGSFYAFNPDGTTKWSVAGPTNSIYDTGSAAIADDGTIYMGGTGGVLYAFNPADGSTKWTFSVPAIDPSDTSGRLASFANAPALGADGTVYIKADDFRLYALDPATGTQKYPAFDTQGATSYAGPTIASDGTVYIGSGGGKFFALNPDNTLKWSYPADGAIYSSAAIDASGNVYFGTTSNTFYSLTSTGALRWQYKGATNSITSSPALSPDGKTAYFGSYDTYLHAVNTADGTLKWKFPFDPALGQVRASSPAVDSRGIVYIGSYDYNLYAINPDGTLNRTYAAGRWIRSSPVISGTRMYVGSNDHKLYAYELGVGAASAPWPQHRTNSRHTGRRLAEALAIVNSPSPQSAVLGQPLTLSVSATGTAPLAYQWFKDGSAVPGATTDTYSIPVVTASSAGTYTVTVTGPQGTVTSPAAAITADPPTPGRLINLSVRSPVGLGGQTLTVGFVLSAGSKQLLIRGIGPGLLPFGVTDAISDPKITLFRGQTVVDSNDNWGGLAALASTAASVGAFALDAASKDAVLVETLQGGNYTANVAAVGSASGNALAEFYAVDSVPPPAGTAAAHLSNISTLANVSSTTGPLVAGFVITGNLPMKVLIRGVGPSLQRVGVSGFLADPRLELYHGSTLIDFNDNWSGSATLSDAFTRVGAFTFNDAASLDAAMVETLMPGVYTVQLSSVTTANVSGTGLALIEVYEVPQ